MNDRIRQHALDLGFDAVGVTRLRASDHAALYRAWLAAGQHGEMSYLAREDAVARRLDPVHGFPGLKSAIVLAHGYVASHESLETQTSPEQGVIARYAHGRDYHKVLKKKLLALLERIEGDVCAPLPLARAYVDTGPVLERELAQRAGLGWFGRSTMLLHPRRGSYFFISTLLVELELEPDAPFTANHCGTCNACVSACPTGALLGYDENGAPRMDATRCISYLTIEQKGAIPVELRPLIGNRIFGCDICQEVCPWNAGKFVQLTRERDFEPRFGGLSLVELMRMTYDEWDVWTRGSPIRRAGYAGFRRNIAVALGNSASPDAAAVLREALKDESEVVREHAAWALERHPSL